MCIRDRHYLQENKDTPQYKEELKKAHTEVGSLQSLAQKTRPDIACVVAIAAGSVQRKLPREAHTLLA
eukprot:1508874-Prorocentrum_lima.AAC.1